MAKFSFGFEPPDPEEVRRKQEDEAERAYYRDLAKKCQRIADEAKPRLRAMLIAASFGSMHADDYQYEKEGRKSPIESVDDPENGGFRTMPYGIVRSETVEPEVRIYADEFPDGLSSNPSGDSNKIFNYDADPEA